MQAQQALAYAREHEGEFVERLKRFLAIPSVSAQRQHSGDVRQAAETVLGWFQALGMDAGLRETGGHPAVVACAGPPDSRVTVLVYGHYDVQPPGDAALWESPPFEPTIRDGAVFARGAADDKGQVLTHILAAESWLKGAGGLPVRVKFLIEGEEEIGSPNLTRFVEDNRDHLACDYVAISDTAQLKAGCPAITYGTKGLVYKEIVLTGPKQNLHSGSFGGTIENPGNAMAKIIASLKDEHHRVTIPGFYDDVEPLTEEERRAFAALPFSEEEYLASLGSPALVGEEGYTTLERRWARPTLDVNGITGGYTGEGASTVIPAQMLAKVSMRLVPRQDPQRISAAFDEAVRQACPPGVRLEIRDYGACGAYVIPLDCPGLGAARRAVERGFGTPPVLIREGGSLPILPMFKQVLGAESLLLGFCLPNCNAHGPNEFFHLRDFHAGTRSAICLLEELAAL